MRRVLFFIPTLEAGGAERVCVHYVNHLTRVQPMLAVQFKRGPLLQDLLPHVPILETVGSARPERASRPYHRLKGAFTFWNKLPPAQLIFLRAQAHKLCEIAQQNDCRAIMSFITLPNIIAILTKMFCAGELRVIINVHDVTSRILEHTRLARHERVLLRWLIRSLYPKADSIVAVASGIKRDLIENFGVPPEKITVIYNPIDVSTIRRRATEPVDHPWLHDRRSPLIVAVGRLTKLKGFDLLIRAIAQLSRPSRLVIIGDGEERAHLESLIIELGLPERAALLGFQENPWKYMARADLFVLSSLTEGMPNVIGEAMALGLPVLATDCSPGVREYLDDGRAGLLVPPGDPKALAEGIERLLSDELLRKELAQRGCERIAQFDLSIAVETYEKLLESLIRSEENHGKHGRGHRRH